MLPSMVPPRGPGRRLSADDWIQTGFALLADGGPNALRIGRLCERLQVTKGSFYWHFADMQAYRAALVGAWGDLRDEDRRRFFNMRNVAPRERLAVMMTTLVNPAHWAVERVMRVWALTDEQVAMSVRQSDQRVLMAVRQAFTDYGFGLGDASLRSAVMFSAGIGLLHGVDPTRDAPDELREQFLEFMLRP
jgi:AcrR family transcriptional regulator